jgi:hypothetical protein
VGRVKVIPTPNFIRAVIISFGMPTAMIFVDKFSTLFEGMKTDLEAKKIDSEPAPPADPPTPTINSPKVPTVHGQLSTRPLQPITSHPQTSGLLSRYIGPQKHESSGRLENARLLRETMQRDLGKMQRDLQKWKEP